MENDGMGREGLGIIIVKAERLDKVVVTGADVLRLNKGEKRHFEWDVSLPEWLTNFEADDDCLLIFRHNAYVNTGLNNSLDREFGLGGTAIGFIGVSNNATAVTAATVFLNGASGGTAANTIIKAISPAATRTNQTVTGGATFVNADFTSGVFIINKIGFLTTSTDAGTGLVDVIGGTGGASPYARTFSLDLTAAGSFSFTGQIAVTAVAV